jgi:hypothetical protein
LSRAAASCWTRRRIVVHTHYLLFLRDDALVAQAFDAKTLEVSGEVFKIADGVSIDQNRRPMVAAAANGVLAYGTGRSPSSSQMLWLDRTGKLPASGGPVMKQHGIALSLDGRRFAVSRESASQIWIRVPDWNEFCYAVSADGQRFLVLSKPDVQESIHVLTNWTQQIEKK